MSDLSYSAIKIEGGLLSPDLMSRITRADRDLPGISPETYGLAAGERLGEAASRSWEYLLSAYRAFKERLAQLPEGDSATSLTRERWLLVLLRDLGYGRIPYLHGGLPVAEKTYQISHLWEHVPIHLLGWRVELDKRTSHSDAGRAPQSMLQEFLNVSNDHLWSILSNGRVLRILRDSTALVGFAYIEFDLEAIFDGELYSDFLPLYALLHASRLELLPRADGTAPTPADCWLERLRTDAAETGTRVRQQLRECVKGALEALGSGFLRANPQLDIDLKNGARQTGGLSKYDFRDELMRLGFQLIFLFVAEDRKTLLDPKAPEEAHSRYATYFSTQRLRRIASKRRGDRNPDLWQTLLVVLNALGDDAGRPELGLAPLGGLFFAATDDGVPFDRLHSYTLRNEDLLEAVRWLTTFRDRKGRLQRVDYMHLGADELGGVYEKLLELEPSTEPGSRFVLQENIAGNDRKTTGSYYTPTALIDELLKTALDPVIDTYAASGAPEDLLQITVCDPACGSGHFLVAAARRIARRLAIINTGDTEPSPEAVRTALREVIARCIYGVDLNPQAAELAKISLWIESHEAGKPLAFLDPHIKVGNSLLGTTPQLLAGGIPDEAFKPIGSDKNEIVADLRKTNLKERGQQLALEDALFGRPKNMATTGSIVRKAADITAMRPRSLKDVREQIRRYKELENDPELKRYKRVADAWCAAFVAEKRDDAVRPPTSATLKIMDGDRDTAKFFPDAIPTAEMGTALDALHAQYQFFHWHLEFPEVFRVEEDDRPDHNPDTGWQGGFACVIGNPPWERVKLQEQEFFAGQNEDIAKARNANERKRRIERLACSSDHNDLELLADFREAQRKSAGVSQLLRASGRYPLTGKGDVNTYSVFAETARTIINPRGRSGLVLPTGIATDATTAAFSSDLVTKGVLAAFLEFENEEFLLSRDVDHRVRFCLLTVAGHKSPVGVIQFAFGARQIADIEPRLITMTPEDIRRLNPNTGTLPLFRSRRDAEITLAIYQRVPILWQEHPRTNPWGLSFMTMLHMANDSGMFRTQDELGKDGWVLEGNIFANEHGEQMLPLYEAKMIHHFDHRLGTYEGQTQAQANMGTLPRLTPGDKRDPYRTTLPRYWVSQSEVDGRLGDRWEQRWILGWRDIARSTDERTAIFGVFPRAAVGHTLPLVTSLSERLPCLYGNMTSFVLDYVIRQKIAGTHLTYGYVRQLPVLPPKRYDEPAPWENSIRLSDWVERRVLELTYTAWDMAPFARDLGDDGSPFIWDEERRFLLRAELDAAYFHLYGVERDDVDFILSEGFGAFRRNDPERFERTRQQILEIYDDLREAAQTGRPYVSFLSPLPGAGPRHPDN
ncbi:Eco57I restriction-modification methylase domain-containing protein [Actinoallomurus iriomotensis]|uniref:site-specific DNA-methyltransferase (adenine-specific) n=1 Tax=Actinoallomurus iriomotensis TaxID=478107 RepID=A0A9W6W1H8_9ACTN|nr:DNA methyltransferase [Actinoallomurus iriomotensis]GLY85971.1 hypothetical protein Airi02_039000 [Actinoallomurus iriomotensis]